MFQRVIYSLHRRPRSERFANGKSPLDELSDVGMLLRLQFSYLCVRNLKCTYLTTYMHTFVLVP